MLLKAAGAAAIAARCGKSGEAASGVTGIARNGEAAQSGLSGREIGSWSGSKAAAFSIFVGHVDSVSRKK